MSDFTPCPKPAPTVKPPKGMRKVNRARKSADDLRVYGPPARRKLVTLGPCQACHAEVLCDNAHVLGNDGAGRKGGYREIASLCRPHITAFGVMYEGCHALSHRDPAEFRRLFPQFNAKKAARETQRKWRAFLASAQTPK